MIASSQDTQHGAGHPRPTHRLTLAGPRVDRQQLQRIERDLLNAMIDGLGPHITIDFSNVSFFPTVGLGVLIRCHQAAATRGGKVELVGLDENVKQMFVVTQLHRLFDVSE